MLWVRPTYTILSASLSSQFLDSVDATIPGGMFPPIYHTTAETFTPYLTESELERIDNTIMESKNWKVPPSDTRDEILARQPHPKPLHTTWLCGKSAEICGNCGKGATAKMPHWCSM